jgi:hypothetical protein
VRKECPGIADDGRGESKYTKSNGDAGSVHLKQKGRSAKKNKSTTRRDDFCGIAEKSIALPPGFEKCNEEQANHARNNNDDEDKNPPPPFLYFDAGVDEGKAVLEYMRFGRHGYGGGTSNAHNLSRQDAILEYDTAMRHVCETSNFGGCIVRSYLPPIKDTKPWTPRESFPFSWFQSTPSLLKFVVGYRCDDGGDNDEVIVDRLVETATNHKGLIVGFFADLDYTSLEEEEEDHLASSPPSSQSGLDNSLRGFQLQRLKSTLEAGLRVGCPVQIRIVDKPCHQTSPTTPGSIAGERNHQGMTSTPAVDGYSKAIIDLGTVLLETPAPWKVHLSSWNGKAEHLVALVGAFSSSQESSSQEQRNLYFGFDGSVGFSKASHLHESAFEAPLDQIVLESGGPGILPPVVARCCGKNAFCHSGHLPFIAQELARHAGRNPRNTMNSNTDIDTSAEQLPREITALGVARLASATTKALYGLP